VSLSERACVCSLSAPLFVLHCIAFSSDFLPAATAKPENPASSADNESNNSTLIWLICAASAGRVWVKTEGGWGFEVESAKWTNKNWKKKEELKSAKQIGTWTAYGIVCIGNQTAGKYILRGRISKCYRVYIKTLGPSNHSKQSLKKIENFRKDH